MCVCVCPGRSSNGCVYSDLLFRSDMNGANAMLPESSEIHLLESIGIMTSSSTHTHTHTPSPTPQQLQQQQLLVLNEIAGTIVTQVRASLQHPQLARYADQLGDRVAHRLNCLASLAKGHNVSKPTPSSSTASSSSSAPSVDANNSFKEGVMRCFDEASSIVTESIALLPFNAPVRAKATIVCHKLLTCVGGPPCLQRIGTVLPYLVSHCDVGDVDAVIQLIVQVMIEFDAAQSYSIINHFYADIVNKLSVLCASFEEGNRSGAVANIQRPEQSPTAMRQVSASSNYSDNLDLMNAQTPHKGQSLAQQGEAGGEEDELPQVESDRVALQKHLLVFLNQLLSSQLQRVMVSPERNVSLLQPVLGAILQSLNGGTGKISAVSSVPLRRLAIIILTQLTQCWGKASEEVPQQLVDSFYQLLFDQALPSLAQMVSMSISLQHQSFSNAMRGSPGSVTIDGSTSSPTSATAGNSVSANANPANLSLSDAQVTSMYLEMGLLLYNTIHCAQNPAAMAHYLSSVLFPAYGWPEVAIQQLMSFLQTEKLAPSTVRDTFRKFLKSTIQWG
jgi:hypothetical protein